MSPLLEEAQRVHEVAGLSDRTIAAATGAKPSTVRGWLSGRSEPTGARAERLIELAEMIKRLALVVKPESIAVWLMRADPRAGRREADRADRGAANTGASPG